ncbi:hypothetical protein [Aeromonas hydrophila]|uniref:hypothetical protein n=1 Tax=Aeromonas hydrophila TaxID=644 RepID=UPI001FC8318A|nr:hypothetical protein [Aeromonas hydrophila]GKQ97313.1 hypothetical protein KAM461_15630 [Aeromonas hydrophila]
MKNLHFLLRYSDRLVERDTIAEHKDVIAQNGHVWMGKFGVGVHQRFVDIAKKQINDGVPCSLYLMHGSEITSKANVVDLASASTSRGEISSREPKLTPEYYRAKKCSIWFKLSTIEKIECNEINHLWLFNNPPSHPSSAGMRGLIYLTYNDQPEAIVLEKEEEFKSSIYTDGLFD